MWVRVRVTYSIKDHVATGFHSNQAGAHQASLISSTDSSYWVGTKTCRHTTIDELTHVVTLWTDCKEIEAYSAAL